jgi:hypothetical protein
LKISSQKIEFSRLFQNILYFPFTKLSSLKILFYLSTNNIISVKAAKAPQNREARPKGLPFSRAQRSFAHKKNIEEQHNRNQKNENEKRGKAT